MLLKFLLRTSPKYLRHFPQNILKFNFNKLTYFPVIILAQDLTQNRKNLQNNNLFPKKKKKKKKLLLEINKHQLKKEKLLQTGSYKNENILKKKRKSLCFWFFFFFFFFFLIIYHFYFSHFLICDSEVTATHERICVGHWRTYVNCMEFSLSFLSVWMSRLPVLISGQWVMPCKMFVLISRHFAWMTTQSV